MKNVIFDFEFTGLDNNYIRDNEIIQMKYIVVETGDKQCFNLGSRKRITAGAYLECLLNPEKEGALFSKELFESLFDINDTKFHGYSVSKDIEMLNKYNINIEINDIKENFMLSDYEERLAKEGSSLECVYYIISGDLPNLKDRFLNVAIMTTTMLK